jgi:integrase
MTPPELPAVIETAAPFVAAPAEPTVTVVQPATRVESRTIATADLLRPDESLRRSIEGFLLDQRSEHTRRAYGKDLKRFVEYLAFRKAGFGPERIDRSILIAYKDLLLSEGLEHTTIDRHLATLRSFFRWLVDDGVIERNPAEGVRFLNPKRVSRTVGFSDEEVVRILSKPNLHTRVGSLHYAVLLVLFHCGLRRSEVCDLRMSSLGHERGQAVFRLRGKGNAERVIAVVPPVLNALKHYFRITGREPGGVGPGGVGPLFSAIRNNRTGELERPLDPSMIFYIVTKYAKEAGIAGRVSPHSCRATAISNARDRNVPDRAIQEFAGWASPDMITRYDKRKTAVEGSAAHAIRYGKDERPIPRESAREPESSE